MRPNRPIRFQLQRHPVLVALAIAACLILISRPAAAEQRAEESEVIVERPVVVVRTGADEHGFTWTMTGRRSFLGVQTVDLTPELRQYFGVPQEAGVLVAKIVEDSPAAASGLQVGDIISSVDGEDIVSPSDLARGVSHQDPGSSVDLEVWRDGKVQTMQSTLMERQAQAVDIRHFRSPDVRIHRLELDEAELEGAIELETATLNRAIERLNREMDSPEWHSKVHSFTEHQETLMQRIETLEQRLREMEEELRSLEEDD